MHQQGYSRYRPKSKVKAPTKVNVYRFTRQGISHYPADTSRRKLKLSGNTRYRRPTSQSCFLFPCGPNAYRSYYWFHYYYYMHLADFANSSIDEHLRRTKENPFQLKNERFWSCRLRPQFPQNSFAPDFWIRVNRSFLGNLGENDWFKKWVKMKL